MSLYNPDRWVIIELINDDQRPEYKVFGTWLGGYLNGDEWRLNSGIDAVKKDGVLFNVLGYSGSEYVCHSANYGTSAYTGGVLSEITARATEKYKIRVLTEKEGLEYLESMCIS